MRYIIAVLALLCVSTLADAACGSRGLVNRFRERRIRPVASTVKVTVAVATAPVKVAFNCGCK